MALNKQDLSINFSQGLDTKTDPFQVAPGRFLSLENSIFDTAGRLTKRNGYSPLIALPNDSYKYITTFNNNLTAIGTTLSAFSDPSDMWINKGTLKPISVSVLPAVRTSTNQVQADSVTAANGMTCVVYSDINGSTVTYKYVIIDSVTGQDIVSPTVIPADTTYGAPRVFLLTDYFIIVYTTHPAAYHLVYTAISSNNPTVASTPVDISSSYIPATTLAFDGVVVNNRLFIAYNTTSGGQSVKMTYIAQTLGNPVTATTFAGEIATMFSLTADMSNSSNPIIYVSYYNLPTTTGKILAVNQNLNQVLAPTTWVSSGTILNITSTALNGVARIYYEVSNTYSYDSAINTNYISYRTCTVGGVLGTATTLVRSVGLASKAFLMDDIAYMLTIQNSTYQPSYFLVNESGEVSAKLAYSNGPGYYTAGLTNVTLRDSVAKIAYLFKDQIIPVNKTQGSAVISGVYAQLGVNLASFNMSPESILTSEIGQNLNITGGYISIYDGVAPVEQNFFLWPELNTNLDGSGTSKSLTVSHSGGLMTTQLYYYVAIYEWADNQGNIFRSAPSVPVPAAAASFSGSSNSVTVNIPTIRLTYKINVPPKIVIYRWSTAQQTYYQVTSVTSPTLNDPTVDSVQFVDTQADSAIIGNSILYTTGGVVENISPPPSDLMTLFNNRLWLVDAEDRNLLWFSKQVIEATPVEMSDLLTAYVAPSTASQGSTGPITSIAPMDDKLVVFKRNALGFISGQGPDNTGANNQYSDFQLINSTVGCSNQQSIVFTPQGLMFQSAKGIWLLGRDLSTTYIGAPVETFTKDATVLSALNIPSTNQVRFTMDSGITLMYDYYYGQWGTFTNVPAISSTIYLNLHTYIDQYGRVFQETPGSYVDNSNPVLMSFTTSWISLSGLQGFERFYQMYLLGTYITPFKLNVRLAYDFNDSASQAVLVTPDNAPSTWGSESVWGGGAPWGSTSKVFESRVFPSKQKCESFRISMQEVYDSSYGVAPGQGLTLSGLNLVVGLKKGYRTSTASKSFG